MLVIDRPYAHQKYTRLLYSRYYTERLKSVQTLVLSKPLESRHAHWRTLPFTQLPYICNIYCFNLCLAEIELLSSQILMAKSILKSLVCINVETWCHTRSFSADIIQRHRDLNRVAFRFKQNGLIGFSSLHSPSALPQMRLSSEITHFILTSVHDDETRMQRATLTDLERVENSRNELYYDHDLEQIEELKQELLKSWSLVEEALIDKYYFISTLSNLTHLEFGFCYAWTPKMWREIIGKVVLASPQIKHLSLHGWDQLGRLEKLGNQSTSIQLIRVDAEMAIAELLQSMPHLITLRLTDFSVGPGLLNGGPFLSKTLKNLEIVYTRTMSKHFTEPADSWLLLGPLKEFITSIFSSFHIKRRSANIYLHPKLMNDVQRSSYFVEDPFVESIQNALCDFNVDLKCLNYINDAH